MERCDPLPSQTHSSPIFARAFLVAMVSYTILSGWLHLVSAVVSFVGAFLLSYLGVAGVQLYEGKKALAEASALRTQRLIELLENAEASQKLTSPAEEGKCSTSR